MSGTKAGLVAVVLVLCAGGAMAFYAKTDVQSGDLVTCEGCAKEMSNTIQKLSVPWWKAGDYGTTRRLDFCEKCGQESMSFKTHTLCLHCRKEYRTQTQTALRRTRPTDTTQTSGSCEDCETPVTYEMTYLCGHCCNSYKTQTLTEPRWKVPPNKSVKQGYCTPCDTPQVFAVKADCTKCGKYWADGQMQAKPRDNPKTEVSYGLCTKCKVLSGLKSIGKAVGEGSKAIGDGMIEGLRER